MPQQASSHQASQAMPVACCGWPLAGGLLRLVCLLAAGLRQGGDEA